MGITVDMPPAMVQEAREYASMRGMTLEQMLFDFVKAELSMKGEADAVYGYLMAQSGWLPHDYTFDRAEANER